MALAFALAQPQAADTTNTTNQRFTLASSTGDTHCQVKHDEQTIIALYDTLSSLIYSPSSNPPDPNAYGLQYGYHHTLSDYFARYSSLLSPTRARLLHSTRQDRHRACFTSSVDDCAYRLSTIFESPSIEPPRYPLDFPIELSPTPTPAPDSGTHAMMAWSSAEDLQLLATNDMGPIDISNIRAFIDELRMDREPVDPSPSSENIHGSSDTLASAPSQVGSASTTSSKARKVNLVRRVLQVFRRS